MRGFSSTTRSATTSSSTSTKVHSPAIPSFPFSFKKLSPFQIGFIMFPRPTLKMRVAKITTCATELWYFFIMQMIDLSLSPPLTIDTKRARIFMTSNFARIRTKLPIPITYVSILVICPTFFVRFLIRVSFRPIPYRKLMNLHPSFKVI
jgi:hypothetical protein